MLSFCNWFIDSLIHSQRIFATNGLTSKICALRAEAVKKLWRQSPVIISLFQSTKLYVGVCTFQWTKWWSMEMTTTIIFVLWRSLSPLHSLFQIHPCQSCKIYYSVRCICAQWVFWKRIKGCSVYLEMAKGPQRH